MSALKGAPITTHHAGGDPARRRRITPFECGYINVISFECGYITVTSQHSCTSLHTHTTGGVIRPDAAGSTPHLFSQGVIRPTAAGTTPPIISTPDTYITGGDPAQRRRIDPSHNFNF